MNALVRMNNPGGATPEILKQFYDAAATQYPELYKNVTFENWTAFLVTSGLAVQTDDRYQTTPFGSGFLKYVLDMHLITPKPY
jgi:hypothetical protein